MEFGKITEDAIAKLKRRIGVERKGSTMHRRGPLRLPRDVIRRFAIGSGDDNPLYLDLDYAGKSRYRTLIAPPSIIGFTERTNGATDGLPGCHTIWREAIYEWYLPLKMDDVLDSSTYLRRVELIPSQFGGGKAVVQDYETYIRNQRQESAANYRTSWHRFERHSAAKAEKYKRELANYTPADIDKIKADYKQEQRRGRDILWWDDVREGDQIPFVVKGPTTQISKFAFESWGGPGGWFVGHKLAFALFEKHPGLPFINEQGIPEAPVAIHWSNERSQKLLGLPGAYEAGYERTSWIVHMLMNWIGDDGFLHRLTQRYPTFSLLGDTTWCRGTVAEKYVIDQPVDGKRHALRCEIWTVNQRGDTTTTGEAVVLLQARN
ncbi:MAG: MaoC family dehydratase N-terminal domain-containing protein [Deltaproteobacteria bacterium]|nr:MaoC family dehydratase N-terminal domain-containing protein [Deltaproteobacteria bacterium]